jgi:hypothetical protein
MNKQKKYAGIGSRQTPDHILNEMRKIAMRLAQAFGIPVCNLANNQRVFSSQVEFVW